MISLGSVLDLGAGGHQSLTGVVAGILDEVLHEAGSQVLGLGLPLGNVGVKMCIRDSFLMFGNLIRECGVLSSLSQTAQNELANLITLLLGITIAASMKADQFVRWETLMIMGLGLVAFILDSMVGVIFVKILNIFTPKNKINPMVGAAGISAFPMSSLSLIHI